MDDHRYVKAKKCGKTLLGYLYSKYENMSLDGKRYIARGILYDGVEPIVITNVEGYEFEYIT